MLETTLMHLNFEVTFETNGLADEPALHSTTLVAQLEVHVNIEIPLDESLEQRMHNAGFHFEAGGSSRTTQAPFEEEALELHLAQFHLETAEPIHEALQMTWLNQTHTKLQDQTILFNP